MSDENAQLATVGAVIRGLIDGEELDTAIELAEKTLALHPRAEIHALLGIACAKRGLADQGIAAFQAAVLRNPEDIASWTHLAEAQIERCDYAGAQTALEFACMLDPDAEHPSGKRARILIARARKELRAAAK